MFSKITRWWDSFWFAPVDARPFGLFRIALGLLLTCMMLMMAPHWMRFFARDGMLSLDVATIDLPRANSPYGLMYWTDGIVPEYVYWPIGLAAAITFTAGFYTRFSTLVLLLVINSIIRRNPYMVNGEEIVSRFCLFYGLFAPLGAAYSVDAWRIAKRSGEIGADFWNRITLVSPWAIRMIQINVALIYIISLPYKFVQDPGWITGDAMHWAVASDMWGPPAMEWTTLYFGGLFRKLMTWGTVLVEASFPLLVCLPLTRRGAIASVAALHLGIALLIPNVTFFTLAMVCCFFVYLRTEDIDDTRKLWSLLCRNLKCVSFSSSSSSQGSGVCSAMGRWIGLARRGTQPHPTPSKV